MSSMNNETKNVAFFGGSFNPPHIAHIKIGEYLINSFNFNKILYVPTYYTKHKNYNSIEAYEDRYNMIKLAIEDISNINIDNNINENINNHPKIQISDIEKELYIIKKDYTYTYDVLKFLEDKDNLKNEINKYSIVIGFDSIYNIHTWHNYIDLINEYEFIIFDRKLNYVGEYHTPEYSFIDKELYLQKLNKELNLKYIYKDNLELEDISSSYIRDMINIFYKTNDSKILDNLSKYLNENVIEYIINNNLYKD